MSFEFSPEAIIFQLERELTEQQEIFETQKELHDAITIPAPEIENRCVDDFDFNAHENRDVLIATRCEDIILNQTAVNSATARKNEAAKQYRNAESRIEELKERIEILEVDAVAKKPTNLNLNFPGEKDTDEILTGFQDSIAKLTASINPNVTDEGPKKDNTLRNTLLVGGALLLLI